jgi:hypothetical protein
MTKFNVPYYEQSSDFTCGPACVLMVMKHFEPMLEIDRHLEFEVWRQCNMIGIRGADPYGLSVPLIDAGYEVRLLTQRRKVIESAQWRRRLARRFSSEEVDLSLFGMKQNQLRALTRRLKVTFKRPIVNDIIRGLREGFVPICLVHMGVVHSLNIPHWVVVTDADVELVRFNDPYPPKGRKGISLSHAKFQKILDDIGTRIGLSPSVLFVRRQRQLRNAT